MGHRSRWILLLAVLACLGCGSKRSAGGEGAPRVLVSVPPEAWMVESIAGERISVQVLLPPGASPHTYEPSIGRARQAASADLFLPIGHPRLGFEKAWMDALSRLGGPRVVPLGTDCRARPDDPHIWLSADCARSMARRAEAALASLLPPGDSAALRAGLDSTLEAMSRADRMADSLLAPFRGHTFLVFHPAWAYFAADHGLRQEAVQSGSAEPGPGQLARVLSRIREEGLRVMFIQPGTTVGEAGRVARELGVSTRVLDPLERDWPALVVRAARELAAVWSG